MVDLSEERRKELEAKAEAEKEELRVRPDGSMGYDDEVMMFLMWI
jgi:hypothetical protein